MAQAGVLTLNIIFIDRVKSVCLQPLNHRISEILSCSTTMATFNATQPITDPSIFSPRGMYVDNRSSKTYLGDDDEDEPKAFVLDASDMKALNRFLGTGRKLQTTRVEYLRWLGISDNSGEISTDLGKELELLLRTYSSVSIHNSPLPSSALSLTQINRGDHC